MNGKNPTLSSLLAIALAVCAITLPDATQAADAISFTPGNPWAQTVGSISKTDDYHEYTVHASAGKTLKINLISRDPNLFFRVLPPDSRKPLIDTMTSGETSWSMQPAVDTDYTVRVYADPGAIPRDQVSKFALQVGVF